MASALKYGLTGPITVQHFFQSFSEAWRNTTVSRYQRASKQQQQDLPRRIGLAVSGGADSMALAYLCKQLQITKPDLDLMVKAFIVDHKFREESSEEAYKVSKLLLNLGIDSEILSLDWSLEKEAGTAITAFETYARVKRYQALGKACYENRLSALLTGHHLDDNVETAILRLTKNATRDGLTGIAPVARIPHCHGQWGVTESGSFERVEGQHSRLGRPAAEDLLIRKSYHPRNNTYRAPTGDSFDMATGGILLCRPLLPFTKSSILETCSQHNVPYVSDPTNFDVTLTTRNAIRSLLTEKRLPRALQPASMSVFVTQNRESLHDAIQTTDKLLRECKLLEFHAATSTMKVQFPCLDELHPFLSSGENARIQAMALRRITELISPFVDKKRLYSLTNYDKFAKKIFIGQQTEDFTIAGTHYRLLPLGSPYSDNIWHISRALFREKEESLKVKVEGLTEDWCPPINWDNRYWLQFRLPPSSSATISSSSSSVSQEFVSPDITIRPLKTEDMVHVYRRNGGLLRRLFADIAPLKSRFTLPVIVTTTRFRERYSGSLIERRLAVPTMGIELGANAKLGIQWRWGYRNVDTEALRLMGWLRTDEYPIVS